MNNEKSELKCRLKRNCSNRKIALIGNLFVSFIVFQISLNNFTNAQHGRVAPGVNPNKYQQEVPVAKQGKIILSVSDWDKEFWLIPIYHFSIIMVWVTIFNDFSEDVKFHDPSEFAQQNNIPNQNIQQQQQQQQVNQPEPTNLNQNQQQPSGKAHAPHSHQAHGHGIGESVDAE